MTRLPSGLRARRAHCLLAGLALLLLPTHGWAVDEFALKAAVAYKLLMFAEWPPAALPPGAALRLCTPAGGPYAEPLRELRGQRVADHALEIVELSPEATLKGCHALLLDGRAAAVLALQPADSQALLVMADEAAGLAGAAVRFSVREGRIGFDVDLPQVRRRGLRLSAQLLRLARLVIE